MLATLKNYKQTPMRFKTLIIELQESPPTQGPRSSTWDLCYQPMDIQCCVCFHSILTF